MRSILLICVQSSTVRRKRGHRANSYF